MNNQIAIRKHVFKTDGTVEPFNTGKLLRYLEKTVRYYGINNVQPRQVTRVLQITLRRYGTTRMTTQELLKKVALMAMYCQQEHPDYAKLAQYIEFITLYRSTRNSFTEVMRRLYNHRDPNTNTPIISRKMLEIAEKHEELINQNIILRNDSKYGYLALRTLQDSYLLRINGKIVERPQHMLMRVAFAVWPESLNDAFEVYKSLSNHYFVPSHLMLKNAGLQRQHFQTSAALTLNPYEPGVSNCVYQVQALANVPVEVAVSITDVVTERQKIPRTENSSRGVPGLFQIFDTLPKPIPGPVSFYLEIWHGDVRRYLYSYDEYSSPEYANYNLVIPDIFMRRITKNQYWSLMCPSECGKLSKLCGEEFDFFYEQFEIRRQYIIQTQSLALWRRILEMQKERGYPSIIFKDNITRPSNYKHLGAINVSNKQTNFAMPSSSRNPASAHSAYLILPRFHIRDTNSFDYAELGKQVKIVTKFLDKAIDVSDYGTADLKKYNKRNRPLAIGVHGLADLFLHLKFGFTGTRAYEMNKQIFDTIYYNALETSYELAKNIVRYPNFGKIPMDKMVTLHVDYWNVDENVMAKYDKLRSKIIEFGVRNSALISLKSDKITSEIMGVSNSVDPYTTFVHKIEKFGDEFSVIHELLLRALIHQGCWWPHIRHQINESPHSVRDITQIMTGIRHVFKTALDILPSELVIMAKDRAPFIDQSQSTKIWDKRNSGYVQRYIWSEKLKTIYKVVVFDSSGGVKLTKDSKPKDKLVEIEKDVDKLSTSLKEQSLQNGVS